MARALAESADDFARALDGPQSPYAPFAPFDALPPHQQKNYLSRGRALLGTKNFDDAAAIKSARIYALALFAADRDAFKGDCACVVANECYGGFGFSKEFMAELYARTGIQSRWTGADWGMGNPLTDDVLNVRTHPTAVRLLLEWGTQRSSKRSAEVAVYKVAPAFAIKHMRYTEYDGVESFAFDYSAYIESEVRAALANPTCDVRAALQRAVQAADGVTMGVIDAALPLTSSQIDESDEEASVGGYDIGAGAKEKNETAAVAGAGERGTGT